MNVFTLNDTTDTANKDVVNMEDKLKENVTNSVVSSVQNMVVEKVQNKAQEINSKVPHLKLGIIFMLLGFLFIALSFLFLPFIIIEPYKFCAMNSLGTLQLFIAVYCLKGKKFLNFLFSKGKVIFTLIYLTTLAFEVYFSIFDHQYIWVLVTMAVHVISALYLLFSSFPKGVGVLNSFFKRICTAIWSGLSRKK